MSGVEGRVVGRVAIGGGGTRCEKGARGGKSRRGATVGSGIAVGGRVRRGCERSVEDRRTRQAGQRPSSGRRAPSGAPEPQIGGPVGRGGGRSRLRGSFCSSDGCGRGIKIWNVVPGGPQTMGQSRGDVDTETVGVNHKCPHP